jgi:hypothetical protein
VFDPRKNQSLFGRGPFAQEGRQLAVFCIMFITIERARRVAQQLGEQLSWLARDLWVGCKAKAKAKQSQGMAWCMSKNMGTKAVTRVGFEPTPFRTRSLVWRLRPLGHLAIKRIPMGSHSWSYIAQGLTVLQEGGGLCMHTMGSVRREEGRCGKTGDTWQCLVPP